MKKKTLTIALILAICFSFWTVYSHRTAPNGKTIESRERILQASPKGADFRIGQEITIKDYIVSTIYSNGHNYGIAVFKQTDKGEYKLYSKTWSNGDKVVLDQIMIDGDFYNVSWLNKKAEKAVYTYTFEDGEKEQIFEFDVEDLLPVYCKAPKSNYNLKVLYYDSENNIYE